MTETRFYTAQEAEAAFYAAFMKHDVNAMMAVWGGDERITCIHPLGPVLTGREAIREAWAAIFRNAPDMQVIITELSRVQDGELAIHVVEEHIRAKNEAPGRPVYATNVYRLTEVGWRMVLHHATPSPPATKADSPTLH